MYEVDGKNQRLNNIETDKKKSFNEYYVPARIKPTNKKYFVNNQKLVSVHFYALISNSVFRHFEPTLLYLLLLVIHKKFNANLIWTALQFFRYNFYLFLKLK